MLAIYQNVGALLIFWDFIIMSALVWVPWGNVVTFFVRNHIFLESFLVDLMLYVANKI